MSKIGVINAKTTTKGNIKMILWAESVKGDDGIYRAYRMVSDIDDPNGNCKWGLPEANVESYVFA